MTAPAKGQMLGKSMMSFYLPRTFVYHTTHRIVQYPFKEEFRADRVAEFLQSKCDSVACAVTFGSIYLGCVRGSGGSDPSRSTYLSPGKVTLRHLDGQALLVLNGSTIRG
jgi:hypothetical protein